jgi:hypothetical protein
VIAWGPNVPMKRHSCHFYFSPTLLPEFVAEITMGNPRHSSALYFRKFSIAGRAGCVKDLVKQLVTGALRIPKSINRPFSLIKMSL